MLLGRSSEILTIFGFIPFSVKSIKCITAPAISSICILENIWPGLSISLNFLFLIVSKADLPGPYIPGNRSIWTGNPVFIHSFSHSRRLLLRSCWGWAIFDSLTHSPWESPYTPVVDRYPAHFKGSFLMLSLKYLITGSYPSSSGGIQLNKWVAPSRMTSFGFSLV